MSTSLLHLGCSIFFINQYKSQHLITTVTLNNRRHLIQSVELCPSSWCLVTLKSASLVCFFFSHWQLCPAFALPRSLSLPLFPLVSLFPSCVLPLSALWIMPSVRGGLFWQTPSLPTNTPTQTILLLLHSLSLLSCFSFPQFSLAVSLSFSLSPALRSLHLSSSLPFIHHTAPGLWELWNCIETNFSSLALSGFLSLFSLHLSIIYYIRARLFAASIPHFHRFCSRFRADEVCLSIYLSIYPSLPPSSRLPHTLPLCCSPLSLPSTSHSSPQR